MLPSRLFSQPSAAGCLRSATGIFFPAIRPSTRASPSLHLQTCRNASRPSSRSSRVQIWQTLEQRRTFAHSARQAFKQSRQRQQQYRRQAFNYQRFQASKGLLLRWWARPTFVYEFGGITVLFAGVYVLNLEHVPVSGRYRFNVVSPAWEKSLAASMYNETMQQYSRQLMPEHTYEHRLVKRCLERLLPHSGLQGEEWEVHVIDDPMKNAFVIPGGKVFVFRGILDVAQGEDGLAAVLGHEIAHNVAHHAAERMSQNFVVLIPAMAAALLLGLDPGFGRLLTNLVFTLPGSRAQESEADFIGLMMMAESCYDPHAAMGLWAAMEQEEKAQGQAVPQFISTHPSNHNRLEKIREWLPQAEEKREQSECGAVSGYGKLRL